ncbi:hypothetical protein ACIHCQ_25370 [Streptomyces sp. NPDC052236]|uniref:hypothetical protein n=1 Tax=Streptomyces sp. NPDC052236 TaxID=3365686 RepID=UPI0037D75279
MKRFLGGAATIALCTGLFGVIGTGTAAAVNTHQFNLNADLYGPDYGYTIGGVTFHNQDVVIQGSVKSHTTGCVQAQFDISLGTSTGVTKTETRTACGRGTGTSTDFHFTVDMPAGGTDHVDVYLNQNITSTTGRWQHIASDTLWNSDL